MAAARTNLFLCMVLFSFFAILRHHRIARARVRDNRIAENGNPKLVRVDGRGEKGVEPGIGS